MTRIPETPMTVTVEDSPVPKDLSKATPDEIKGEIAATRAHMDEHLSQLGRKLKPKVDPALARIPLMVAFLALAGYLVYRIIRRRSKLKTWAGRMEDRMERARSGFGHARKEFSKAGSSAKVKRLKMKSMGFFDQVRALRLAASLASQGKPAIFVVEPR